VTTLTTDPELVLAAIEAMLKLTPTRPEPGAISVEDIRVIESDAARGFRRLMVSFCWKPAQWPDSQP
jgi:hypothetical protein